MFESDSTYFVNVNVSQKCESWYFINKDDDVCRNLQNYLYNLLYLHSFKPFNFIQGPIYNFLKKINVGCLSDLRNYVYILKPRYCTRCLQAMVTRGAYSLIWPIGGCAAGQSMVFVLSDLDRDYDFVRVCPIYKHGSPIYLIGLQNSFVFQVYTKAITLRWVCSIVIANKMVLTPHENTDLPL